MRPTLRLPLGLLLALALVGGTCAPADAQVELAQEGGTPGLAEARRRANAAAAEINAIESELGELDAQITRSRAEAEAAQAEHDALRDQVRDLAVRRYTQVGDTTAFVRADLNQQGRAQALMAAVTGERVDTLDDYRATRARLDASLDALAEQEADQRAALDELAAQRAALDAELSRLEALEAQRLAEEQRRREEEARRAAEAEARRQAEEQARLLAAQQQAAADGKRRTATSSTAPPTTSPGRAAPSSTTTTTRPTATPGGGSGGSGGGNQIATGTWVCPVQGARSFVDSWGFPRPGGRRHQGVDIMSPRGTPVVTPVAGVVQLRSNGIGGLSFHLNGADGNYYYGTHMDAYADISNGSYPAGTVVGYVGDTGDAKGTGTHLHFEIHVGGGAINPYPTVARHC